MAEVRETKLPGVGVRHEFTSEEGNDMAVIVHRDGRREILAYDVDDPDLCHPLVSLSESDTHTLAEILGVSHVTETVAEIRQEIEGLAIEWVELSDSSEFAGVSLGEGGLRTKTGASVVAIMRGADPIPAPGADFVLQAGDVVVAVGTTDGLTALRSLLGH
jgi:TrkA domain protein